MFNKKGTVLTLTSILAIGLMTSCDNAKQAPDTGGHGHGGNHNQEAVNPEENGHSGHGGGHETASNNYQAEFTWNEPASAGTETELTIQITDNNGGPVQEFDVNHEKLLHLIIVNRDLSFFNHIHPDYKENGEFTVNTTFPAGGEYKLIADFVPKGAGGSTLSEWVQVEGEEGEPSAIEPDSSLIKQVNGKEIELSLSNALSNEEVVLTYHIQDAQTKQGISNLEPYLGAVGHVVILSADAEKYIHVHPLDESSTGPKAEFATTFPHSGIYKIWGQFQHQGEVMTVPFVVEIK
ncbi:hypothetical protein [Paenibacillus sp. BR1-192]|uniref:hypothetical protein n=1 Tax=Paenibacillus sp. BR1-192 TaxID=3032287 RepID=UPI00240E8ACA|nr:hypothetical protein [Paenibacillus sp. BR1-192]WFB60710.1 hypothetical protein P0X86_11125 [Paenibacillus sp. BR1-192]